ncbi:hypothetical protein OAM07_05920 [Crocinitomicaceae bacterium]|nr:hypothetical protein [Crocinitomicaceae bacterium]
MNKTLFFCFFFIVFSISGQNNPFDFGKKKKSRVVRSGTFFGVQTGRFWVGEIGVERQSKQLKIKKPNTQALFFALNYDIDNAVIGSDVGYWFKTSNLGFSYGLKGVLKSNFSSLKYGFSPTIGYKVLQLHVTTGYQFLLPTRRSNAFDLNYLFLSVKFLLVNDLDIKKKRKKN